jgi:hypothetical protein
MLGANVVEKDEIHILRSTNFFLSLRVFETIKQKQVKAPELLLSA